MKIVASVNLWLIVVAMCTLPHVVEAEGEKVPNISESSFLVSTNEAFVDAVKRGDGRVD